MEAQVAEGMASVAATRGGARRQGQRFSKDCRAGGIDRDREGREGLEGMTMRTH